MNYEKIINLKKDNVNYYKKMLIPEKEIIYSGFVIGRLAYCKYMLFNI